MYAQQEANNWYFGVNAGLNFNGGVSVLQNGAMNTHEGCASFSDEDGQLLFYTDGMTIWNKNHNVMPNGSGLSGDSSSTQSSIIVPNPADENLFYLFTVGSAENSTAGLFYYVVDITANGGLGNITLGPINLSGADSANWTEKITAVHSSECNSFWVISHVDNRYFSYKITGAGINLPVISTIPHTAIDGRGYLKVSPNGEKLAAAHYHDNNGNDSKLLLYDFDKTTGIVSNEQELFDDPQDLEHPYGLEFSPSSERLYLSTYHSNADLNKTYQFNIEASNISASKLLLKSQSGFRGSLQLGPDKRIYATVPVSYSQGTPFLDVIEFPDNLGIICNYTEDAINLGTGLATQGLPPFIQSLITSKAEFIDIPNGTKEIDVCDGDTYTIKIKNYPNAYYTWKFISGGTENTLPTQTPPNQYTINQFGTNTDGTYEVIVTFSDGSCPKNTSLDINFIDTPNIPTITNWYECSTNGNGFFDFNFDTMISPVVLDGDSASDFSISYYSNQNNAHNSSSVLSFPYVNQVAFGTETIWVRKENNTTGCYTLTSFDIAVFDLNISSNIPDLHTCDFDGIATDTDTNDGFASFDLTQNNAEILNGSNPDDFEIKYYIDAALSNLVGDPTAFTNTTISIQTIYFTITSNLNSVCTTDGSYTLIVDPNPVFNSSFTTTSLSTCAVGDSNSGIFNLNSITNAFQNSPDYTYSFYLNGALIPATQDISSISIANGSTVQVEASSSLGCVSRSNPIDIIVYGNPQIIAVAPLEECDIDLDGSIDWDLTTNENILTSNGLFNITYHETEVSSLGGNGDIITTPTSFASGSTTIYYRLQDPTTGCLNYGSFDVVLDAFPTNPTEYTFEECDDIVHDGIKSFFLPGFNDTIINSIPDISILGYYLSPADITNPAINPLPNNYTTGDTTLYVHLQDDINGCTTYTEVHLVVLNIPNVNENVPNLVACDDDYDGETLFNLTLNEPNIVDMTTLVNPAFEYFTDASLSDASKIPTDELTSFQNTASSNNFQEIWVKVSSDAENCFGATSFNIVVNPKPIINPIENLKECSDEDGYVFFDLTLAEDGLLNGQIGMIIKYFPSYLDATSNTNEIPNPANYQNTTIPVQTIYYTLENTITGCTTVASFNIEVIANPTTPAVQVYDICDVEPSDGVINLDLSFYNDYYKQGQTNYVVSYHETQLNAENNSGSIDLSNDYINSINPYNFEIFVRIFDTDTGCFSTTSFTVNVLDIPNPTTPDAIATCDVNSNGFTTFDFSYVETEIVTALGNVNVSFYLTEINAENAVSPLTNIANHANLSPYQEIIYIRVEDAITGCFKIVELELNVVNTPEINNPTKFEQCDSDTDGFEIFNLTEKETEITTDTNLTFQYFINTESAVNNNGIGEITNPSNYTNITNPQTVTIRVNNNGTGCYSLTTLELIVNELPVISQPTPYELCDDGEDGDFSNGLTTFNLVIKDVEILNGETGLVTYHETEDGPAIDKYAPYTNLSPTQSLFVKVQNIETGCESSTILDLIVFPLPHVEDLLTIEECDDDYDGHTFFDLDAIRNLYDPSGLYGITFYETEDNAENDQLPLTDSSYYSIVNNIYVRIQDPASNCFIIREITLVVNPRPAFVTIEDMEACEGDVAGESQFDFLPIEQDIVGTNTNLSVKFFTSQTDAENNIGSIDTNAPFTNSVNPQTIWVRMEFIDTGCYTLTSFDLIVNPKPLIGDPLEYHVCDDDNDGFATFYLNEMNDEALVGQLGVSIRYYLTEEDALNANDSSVSPLPNAYQNTTIDAQDIYVRAENVQTGCFTINSLTLVVEPLPEPNFTPAPLTACDEDGDGVEIFNLNDAIPNILNGALGYDVKFYPTQADANNTSNEITDLENHSSTSTTIIATVINTNTTNLCEVYVSLDLIVHGVDELIVPNPITFCDTDTDGIIQKSMDELTSIIFSSTEGILISYHTTENDATNNANPIVVDHTISNTTIIYVRVEDETTNCATVAEVNFEINLSPEGPDTIDPYVVCGEDGVGTFQLAANMDAVLALNSDISVIYFETEEDAINNENSISGEEYISESGTLWALLTNNITSCTAVISFEIEVKEMPFFEVSDTVVYCIDEIDFSIEVENPSGDYTYQWADFDGNVFAGETESSLAVTEEGIYAVKAFTTDGTPTCESEWKYIVVKKSELPKLTIDDITITDYLTSEGTNNIQIDITNIGIGEYEFSIDGGTTWQTTPFFENVPAGAYQLTIRDIHENGCGEITIDISVVGFPEYFTPNGDGIHDYWTIHGIQNYPEAKIYIFDRFGKSLVQIDPTTQGWDGTRDGQELPSSGYWFTMELTDINGNRIVRRGHFNLKR